MSTPQVTIEKYIESTRTGDVEGLKNLFLPEALMSGFYEGEFYLGSPEVFFDEVRDNPSPSETGKDYAGEIACVDTRCLILSKTYINE